MALVEDVCRLCLSNNNLVWVFDERFDGNNMKEVIYITTGVEVHQKDLISQRICKQCCHVSIKMFQFRNASQKNDRKLKEQYNKMLKTSPVEHKIPNTSVTIKAEIKVEPKKETKVIKPNFKVHPSVANLFKTYPGLKLPAVCLKSDIEPWVSMELNAVEEYLKEQKKRQASIKPRKSIAKKSTSASIKSQRSNFTATAASAPLHISFSPVENTDKNNGNDGSNIDQRNNNSKTVSESEVLDNRHSKGCQNDEMDDSEVIPIKSKKRRLTDSDFFSDSETKDSSSSEPLHRENSPSEPPHKKKIVDGLWLDKSVPLFICNICNAVHNNAKELKRHQFEHLGCPFCKTKFRTTSAKDAHVSSLCSIKNMMNDLPSVELKRIELDLKTRIGYPDAFDGYPAIPGLQLESNSSDETSEAEETTSSVEHGDEEDEVIEILSDDDDDTSFQPKTDTSLNEKEKASHSEMKEETAVVEKVPGVTAPPIIPRVNGDASGSVSIVKPDIRIQNSNVLDNIDPKLTDIKVLKELLTKHVTVKFRKDGSSQTEMPSNKTIHVSQKEHHAELKHLKGVLFGYNVPIIIKQGPFQVAYDHGSISETRAPKKLCLWNDLTPIDLRRTSCLQNLLQSSVPVNTQNVATAGITSSNILSAGITSPNFVNARIASPHFANAITPPSNTVGAEIIPPNFVTLTSPPSLIPLGLPSPNEATQHNQRVYNRNNSHNPPAYSLTRPSDQISNTTNIPQFQFHPQRASINPVVPSNLGINATRSVPDLMYIHPGTNPSEQQMRSPPLLASMKTMDMRGPPNVNIFDKPNVASTVSSRSYTNNAPDVSNSHSMIYNLQQNISVTQKNSEPAVIPLSAASDSKKTGPIFGTIRVRNMKELT